MGGEKRGSKASGFFHLFDWNRKSRKKLFQVEVLLLIDEDEIPGAPSIKGSSDYSCASSVTDEEGQGVKAPGVVARLMGLDALPSSGISEPYCTPLFVSKSFQENSRQKGGCTFLIDDQFGRGLSRADSLPRKPVDLRTLKMPRSPIERFQTESLPPRSAKPLPITHHKLLSPIKTPGFISPKNAAHIYEAAAKILEPGLRTDSRSRTSLFGTPSTPLKVRDSKDLSLTPQRSSRLPETARRFAESSAFRSLKGQALNRSWNGSDDTVTTKSSVDTDESTPVSAQGKGKSVSLAVQAKVNVQQRGNLNVGSKSMAGRRNHKESGFRQQVKNKSENQRSRQLREASTASTSTVLQQNNQKQNSRTSRNKLTSRQPLSNQQVSKFVTGDSSSSRSKDVNKPSRSSKTLNRKGQFISTPHEDDSLISGTRDYPRKKRLIDRESYSTDSRSTDIIPVDGREKNVQQNVVIDEHSKWLDDSATNGSDIVSFTFNSPLVKLLPGSQTSSKIVRISDKTKESFHGTSSEYTEASFSNKGKPSLRSTVLGGDALSILLEQKLRELTTRIELSSSDLLSTSSMTTSEPALQESQAMGDSPYPVPVNQNQEFLFSFSKDETSGYVDSSITDQALSTSDTLQGVERVGTSYGDDASKEPESTHPSPLSILEATFSNESCNSSESWESTNGSKVCSSSVQAQDLCDLDSVSLNPSVENEMELTDSASSSFFGMVDRDLVLQTNKTAFAKEYERDLEYVREILSSNGFVFMPACATVEPFLFDKLEGQENGTKTEGVDSRMKRKVLFDCVNECLDMKYRHYFQAGYRMWAKGVTVVGKELAEELYNEILQWKSMGDWMVDELVDKDMSSHLGRWVDFEIEAFEAGVEVANDIFNKLVDEIVTDILIAGM